MQPVAVGQPSTAAPQMQLMQVQVPDGIGPGMQFQIMANNQPMMVTAPPDAKPGAMTTVQVPMAQAPVAMAQPVAQPVAQPAMAVAQPAFAQPAPVVSMPAGMQQAPPTIVIQQGPTIPSPPGQGVPPGAPPGGSWQMHEYWGNNTWIALRVVPANTTATTTRPGSNRFGDTEADAPTL